MRSLIAPLLRYGASPSLRLGIAQPLAAQQIRNYGAQPSRNQTLRYLEKAARAIKEDTMSSMHKMANVEYFKDGSAPLLPGTFISLPLSRLPRNPVAFAQYQAARLKHWFIEVASVLQFKLRSMPNWTTRPKWKARRRNIAPTAKALYQEMLEAFAAGDRSTLQKVCVGDFSKKLIGAIDRRNPRERVQFELIKYNNQLFYPGLKSHTVTQINTLDKNMMHEHGIAAISSTQQISRHDATTKEVIPGSFKIQDKVEYVVIIRQINATTFESTPWRLWGTTSATTLTSYLEEKKIIDEEQAKRVGWKPSK